VKIAVVGRGNVGGGLGDLWEQASHEVKRIGREGGDVSDAEVVVVAVPGGMIAEALNNVRGMEGKMVVDATNLGGADPPEGFSSNAEFVKSRTNGPTAKSFNTNFAALYGRIGEARATPSNLWCGDEEARQVVEQLNRDAGFEPVYAGPLETPRCRRTSSNSCLRSTGEGRADSFIGWHLLIDSEATIEEGRTSDEHNVISSMILIT
jgi:8-hydroxy-5-deazaflavin:NADPH oxidoreductase